LKRKVCIIGSGTAGLHLGYALKEEFDVTMIDRQTPEQLRKGRIRSTQVHFGATRARENRFHMPKWEEQTLIESVHITVGEQKLFVGRLKKPALSVDQRFYFSHCMKDLEENGVFFRFERVDTENMEAYFDEFDLVIDCTGKTGPLVPLPVVEDLSPFQTPQRKCIVGYFVGVRPNPPLGISVTILPGQGEMFEIPALTEQGPVTILFIEAVPNGALDVFNRVKTAEEFTHRMKSTVQAFFPEIHQRIDEENYALCDENGFLQIALTPVIRKPYAIVKNKLVIACGDSAFLNDPITGQGCNLSSYCAEQLYETLIESKDTAWDRRTGEIYWERTKPFVKEVTEWTNAMTLPLPEHVIQFLFQGSKEQAIADEIAEWFADPSSAYRTFFSQR
jgi:hypothetical protein